jgi:ribose 5-phosphate isomerase B
MKKALSIVIGADHRGYDLKKKLISNFTHDQYEISWIDVGAYNDERSDYPEFSIAACHHILKQKADCGILLCGTGTGMAVTANRFPTIYAGVAWNEEIARLNKTDDNVNVLVLPADFVDYAQSVSMIQAWLSAEFKHDRYEKRIGMIDAILM